MSCLYVFISFFIFSLFSDRVSKDIMLILDFGEDGYN